MAETDSVFSEIDRALSHWRQGDCIIGEQWFAHRFAPDCPVSDAAKRVASQPSDLVESPVAGFAVVSQTCDIVRPCHSRPFVEVAPLVTIDSDDEMKRIARGHKQRYAFVPALADRRLVADLDRIMTVEKPVVAKWARIPGCRSDSEVRAFNQAVARKRLRFAFPDDFTELLEPLRKRVLDKHGRNSPEGQALLSLLEIRVRAAPTWDAAEVDLFFWFIRDDQATEDYSEHLSNWLGKLHVSGRFGSIDGVVVTLDDLTAREYVESDALYVESDALDLDHLSVGQR